MKSKAKEDSSGKMALLTLENLKTIILRVRVLTLGVINVSSSASGRRTKCTERVCSHGQMEENISGLTRMMLKMELVSSSGLTEGSSLESGKMESRKVMESTSMKREKVRKDYGPMAQESNGTKLESFRT